MLAARSKSTVGRVTISKKVTGPSTKSSSSTLPQLSGRSSFSSNNTFTILVRNETSERKSHEVKYSTKKMVKVMNACDDKRKAGGEEDPNNNDADDEEVDVRCRLNPERVQDLKNIGLVSNFQEEESK